MDCYALQEGSVQTHQKLRTGTWTKSFSQGEIVYKYIYHRMARDSYHFPNMGPRHYGPCLTANHMICVFPQCVSHHRLHD